MKQFIKSYHLFLSQPWLRWVMYGIYPISFIGIFGFLYHRVTGGTLSGRTIEIFQLLILFTLSDLIISFELFFDTAVFGGIAAKDTNKLEYLKTSAKGMPLFQKSLIADGIRRFISLSIIVSGYKLLCPAALTWSNTLSLILILFLYIEAGLLCTRHFPSMPIMVIVLSVIMLIMPATISALLHMASQLQIALPLSAGIIISVFGRWLIISKVRNSYYDNRNEKGI